MTTVDCRHPDHVQFPASNVAGNNGSKYRPTGPADNGKPIRVSGWDIRDAVDQVGIMVDASYGYATGSPLAVAPAVTVEDIRTRGFRRSKNGPHCEDINVRGSFDPARPADLTIRNVEIADSDTGTPPVFINDAHWWRVRLDGIRSDRGRSQATVLLDLKGDPGETSCRVLVVTNCPGVQVLIQGRPLSLGCVVTDGSAYIRSAATKWKGEEIRPVYPVLSIEAAVSAGFL